MVKNRDGGVAGENEIAVHAMNDEVMRYRELRGGEALGDRSAAIYAARPWRVP